VVAVSLATATGNPGAGFVRISLVAPEEDCVQAAARITEFIQSRKHDHP
jgi:aspartate/methionine/tyrosine aminotransferase